MPGHARRGPVFASLAAAAIAVSVGSPGIAAADGGRPQVNPEEKAAAMIRPAVMYLAGQSYGAVRLPDGQILSQFGPGTTMPFIAAWACTAFVINPDGWVATAGHCVDPDTAKLLILKRAAKEYITQFPDAPDARTPAAALEWLQKNAKVEGNTADRGPEVSLALTYGSGTTVAGKLAANVVDFRPLGKGDVALLKVDKHNLPSSELATDADVSIGTSVLAVGFSQSTENVTGPSLDPTNKSGKVSKKSTMGSAAEYEIDAPVSEGMSGGPTVALNGKVIGVNSFAPVGEPQPFNFVAPADGLATILASKGVKAGLGPADLYYRNGLKHYYAGQYSAAIDDFDQTLSMSPDYPGLVDLRTSAANLRQQHGDFSALSGANLWWYIAGEVAAVLAVAAAFTLLIVRRRRPLPSLARVSAFRPFPRRRAAAQEAPIEPHFCSNCGAEHHPAERFCPNCGHPVATAESAVEVKRSG
ncbi:trypsin-like peptidase domain-containing protein [Mycobacterium interjectum]|uniref:trypsin-like peptidase domain-containing protein n=2 Tax=Mycobacterium interjectum TaxID=33895 RepID=UPI000836F6BD|nr:trypsin-like peptidase domain-containing protein [Mycobacterium interjectum]